MTELDRKIKADAMSRVMAGILSNDGAVKIRYSEKHGEFLVYNFGDESLAALIDLAETISDAIVQRSKKGIDT